MSDQVQLEVINLAILEISYKADIKGFIHIGLTT
jgi:hypothetical protein